MFDLDLILTDLREKLNHLESEKRNQSKSTNLAKRDLKNIVEQNNHVRNFKYFIKLVLQ